MAKKKKGKSLNFELIIIGVFFFSFIVWSTSKCNEKRRSYRQKEEAAQTVTTGDTTKTKVALQPEPVQKPVVTKPKPVAPNLTKLFVLIDGLNLRKEPSLNAAVITKLSKGSQVYFLNEVTDFTQVVKTEDKTELEKPWVKVKTKNGLRGWVFGAYVDYYMR